MYSSTRFQNKGKDIAIVLKLKVKIIRVMTKGLKHKVNGINLGGVHLVYTNGDTG